MQDSFAKLFQSSHLGVVICNEERAIDANDAFLRMIGYTRDELVQGLIDWRELTPPEFKDRDQKAVEQLRNYGVAVPYEKAFLLREGKRVDLLTGAVRLSEKPFTLVSYTIDVSETNRLRQIKQELQARQKVIHQLAHELNNPLAALTLLLHVVVTSEDLAPDTRELLQDAVLQLDRISDTVREVVAETRQACREIPGPENPEPQQQSWRPGSSHAGGGNSKPCG